MELADLRPLPLFDGVTDAQLAELIGGSADVRFAPGDELFHEGDPADSWWVLIDGEIELLRHIGREIAAVGRMNKPGVWAGGFRAWDPQGVYLASGRAVAEGRLLQVPVAVLRERTDAWFPLGGHLIDGLYSTARSIESTARQRESLVTLGTLAAGLAHELNNPAAAALRAVDALEETCKTLLASLGRLASDEISAAQFRALDELRGEAKYPAVAPDPLALADREDELSRWLARHGVERDYVLAPAFAAAGLDVAWCDRVAAVLPGTALGPGLEWVASTLSATTLLREVTESTRRVSELVSAVRSYSQMDRASRQSIDPTEGLESTLVMLGHKLRGAITVVRDYSPDLPRIEAYPGELNQVWTNLIDNAVDAMDGDGILRLGTRLGANADTIVVEIADTGPGMPSHVAARAFEAFYTTKEVGKGTGLGLEIARRIVVERHGGTITIDSRPGHTVLRVTLPVRIA